MKFCSQCQAEITWKIPAGDNRHRFVCEPCDLIFYKNPRIVAGTLPVFENKILLCRRAIEPRRGFWTLPAGFMENGESTEQGALRETWEEAQAEVVLGPLYSVISVPHINQVHMFFLAKMNTAQFAAGDESLEVALFDPKDIPWNELAFPTIVETLERYIKEAQIITSGELNVTHVLDIPPHKAMNPAMLIPKVQPKD
ncbi:MAG: NUDIX hydrolase [Oleibacter sp.]|nr:NUDIX hydrolase [Thalassolituus sp.]